MALTSLSKITNRARGQNFFAFPPLYVCTQAKLNNIKILFLGKFNIYMWDLTLLVMCLFEIDNHILNI